MKSKQSGSSFVPAIVAAAYLLLCCKSPLVAYDDKSIPPPDGAVLVFEEDWAAGRIDPAKWYLLRKRWGSGNNGVVPENVAIVPDVVFGQHKNVLVCRGHGDDYDGPVKGWQGDTRRVGGVIVSKPFFASGQFEVVMKIGQTAPAPQGPDNPARPIGMIPAIWTYAYRWVAVDKDKAHDFSADMPLYNPHMNHHGWAANEYWSEPESSASIASVRVWQCNDPGDVRGILVDDIDNNMDIQGTPNKK